MLAGIERAGGLSRFEPVAIGNWTFRSGQPGDEAATIAILRQSFARWPPWPIDQDALDLLHWYAEGPRPGAGGWIVADDGSTTTAIGLGFERPVRLAGHTVVGVQEGFIAVHPDHRGRGGLRMYMALSRQPGVDLIWGFTQVEPLLKIRRRDRSIQPANQLSVFARILSPLGAWRARRHATLRHLPGYGLVAARGHLRSRRLRGRPDWEISVGLPFDERVDGFFDEAAEPFDFIPERSASYLNWRHHDTRAGQFVTLVAEHEGRMLGYAALRMIQSRAHLADVLTLPGRPNVVASLVQRAVTIAASAGASGVECTLPVRHPYTSPMSETTPDLAKKGGRVEACAVRVGALGAVAAEQREDQPRSRCGDLFRSEPISP